MDALAAVTGIGFGVLFLLRGDYWLAAGFLFLGVVSLIGLAVWLRRRSADVAGGPSPSDP